MGASAQIEPLTPFLIHHDRTPVLTFGSFTGLIEIDAVEEKMLGVDRSFWIAVSLTYLEFLENREVSRSAHLFVIVTLTCMIELPRSTPRLTYVVLTVGYVSIALMLKRVVVG